MINCIIWSVLLFISSCIIANMARKHSGWGCEFIKCNHLGASAVCKLPMYYVFSEIRNLCESLSRNSFKSFAKDKSSEMLNF